YRKKDMSPNRICPSVTVRCQRGLPVQRSYFNSRSCSLVTLFHILVWIDKDEKFVREPTQRVRSFLFTGLRALLSAGSSLPKHSPEHLNEAGEALPQRPEFHWDWVCSALPYTLPFTFHGAFSSALRGGSYAGLSGLKFVLR